MRIPRVYHSPMPSVEEEASLQASEATHLRKVLRIQPGQLVDLFDGQLVRMHHVVRHGRVGLTRFQKDPNGAPRRLGIKHRA